MHITEASLYSPLDRKEYYYYYFTDVETSRGMILLKITKLVRNLSDA